MKSLRKITTAALVLATAGLLVASGMYAAYGQNAPGAGGYAQYTAPSNLFTTSKPAMNDPGMAFTTLRKAIVYAGLQGTLDGQGPATIFAPDDRAFAKVPRDTFNMLFNNKAKLQAVLKYHVILGQAIKAQDLAKMGNGLKTLEGSTLTFATEGPQPGLKVVAGNRGTAMTGGTVYTVNGAEIIWANIPFKDGRIVHAIDKVLIPNM